MRIMLKKEFVAGFIVGWLLTVLTNFLIFSKPHYSGCISKVEKEQISPQSIFVGDSEPQISKDRLLKMMEIEHLRLKGYAHMAVSVPPPIPKKVAEQSEKKFGNTFVYTPEAKRTVAYELAKRVKIFCYINTDEMFHESRAHHIRATWASHCNKFVFFSSKDDPTLPAKKLDVPRGREHLWLKLKKMLRHLEAHEDLDQYDWFYRADDDTYAIIENMRLMLLSYSPDGLFYFGFKVNALKMEKRDFDFVASGAGFIMSRGALKKLLKEGLDNPEICLQAEHHHDDQQISTCLTKLGVTTVDSRDHLNRHRFMAVQPERIVVPTSLVKNDSNWVHYWSVFPIEQGPDCCSDFAVAFHYIEPAYLYLMEYLLYHLRPYGVFNENNRNVSESIRSAERLSKKLRKN